MSHRDPSWDDLSDRDRENFRSFLHDHGITVSIEDAREYYGNPEKVEKDATEPLDDDGYLCPECMAPIDQEGLLLDGEPGFCPYCGEDLSAGPGDPSELIEEITVRITPELSSAIETGSDVTDETPEEFCRAAIRSRVQALERVLREHGGPA